MVSLYYEYPFTLLSFRHVFCGGHHKIRFTEYQLIDILSQSEPDEPIMSYGPTAGFTHNPDVLKKNMYLSKRMHMAIVMPPGRFSSTPGIGPPRHSQVDIQTWFTIITKLKFRRYAPLR